MIAMKEKFYTFCLFVLCVGFLFFSCQQEESILIDETSDETITGSSLLGQMLASASQNNGGIDDIIDGNSCFSLQLPVTVHVNSQVLTIHSIFDLQTIQLIFDQSQNDTDTIEMIFPIEIVYEDYSVETINDIIEMETLQVNCPNFIDDTYSCVEFLYPISCFTYNSLNQQTGLVTMNNDLAWFEYLTYLSEDTFISIDYDMTIKMNNEVITVANNEELIAAFAQTNCEVSLSDINPEVDALRGIMKYGTWYVSQYLDDGGDETSDYLGYDFNFRDSITVYSYGGGGLVYGNWIVTYQNDQVNFEFDMDSPINGANNDTYEVLSQTENKIIFITKNSSGDIEDTLIFTQN
ncbi:MAG: hypothetical protein ACI83B_001053 [Sediminicola sp.]|jgi:hypothetical protein|tara:strand:- start:48 stop:1097 length:1050 start_codon:yes stop_codon:yes gene_type:complete